MYERREKVTVYCRDICRDVGCLLYKLYVSGGWGCTIDVAAPDVKAVKEARLPWAGDVSGGRADAGHGRRCKLGELRRLEADKGTCALV